MSRYLVGIDLGTSHTVVAYAAAGSDAVRLLEIPQLGGPGEVAARLLARDRVGRDRLWRMHTEQLTIVRCFLEQMSLQWDLRLERLRAFVEDGGSSNGTVER